MDFLTKYKEYTIVILHYSIYGVTSKRVMDNDRFATESESVFNWSAFKPGDIGYPQNEKNFIFLENKGNNVILYQLGE